jgi:hypothetical protein
VDERLVIRPHDISFEPVDEEMLIIDFVTSDYYLLNATAATVWAAIATSPRSADELAAALATAHGCAIDDVRHDVDGLLQGLAADGLVVSSNADGAADDVEISAVGAYVVPRFEKFGTLERLMLAGE